MRYVLLTIIAGLAVVVLARPAQWAWNKFTEFVKRIDPKKIEQQLTSEQLEEKEKDKTKH